MKFSAKVGHKPRNNLEYFQDIEINPFNSGSIFPFSGFVIVGNIMKKISKVKVMIEIKGQGHILYQVSNQCTSFLLHINRTNHSRDMAKILFDLERTHPKILRKFTKITVSNITTPKSTQVITMTRAIKLPRFVVIWSVVLTLSHIHANFC